MSLGWKLALVVAGTALATLGGIAGVARLLSQGEIIQYSTAEQQQQAADIAPLLADFYQAHEGWGDLTGPLGIGKLPPLSAEERTALPPRDLRDPAPLRLRLKPVIDRNRIVVTDAQGGVVADTMAEEIGQMLEAFEVAQGQPITVGGEIVGRVYVGLRASIESERLEAIFAERLQLALWATGVLAGGLTLLLGSWFVTHIVRPIHALERSAQRVARGEFDTALPLSRADELGQLARTFSQMAEALATSQRVRRQMVADIAHELRTPLAVIQGNLEAMADGMVEQSPDRLSSIHTEALLLGRLVEDLRTLSLAEAGELGLILEPLALAPWLDQLATSLGASFDASGVRLELTVEEGVAVQADANRLRQVVLNLLTNALQHTPSGGAVRVRASAQGQRVTLEIADTGSGIPQDELAHLFDRFHRGRRARVREGSTGLGLAIVKALVEAHGGAISVTSQPGCGAAFCVTLPRGKALT